MQCRLDSDIARFRKQLNDRVWWRSDAGHVPAQVKGPGTPDMPPPLPLLEDCIETGEPIYNTSVSRRKSAGLELKKNVVGLERPPQQQSKYRF